MNFYQDICVLPRLVDLDDSSLSLFFSKIRWKIIDIEELFDVRQINLKTTLSNKEVIGST